MLQSTVKLVSLYRIHRAAGCNEPLGVFFCKRYSVQADDQLQQIYHTQDEEKAAVLINDWLGQHKFHDTLPPLREL